MAFKQSPWQLRAPGSPEDIDDIIGRMPSQVNGASNIDASVMGDSVADRTPASAFVGPPPPPGFGQQGSAPQPAKSQPLSLSMSGITPGIEQGPISLDPLDAVPGRSGLTEEEKARQQANREISSQMLLTMTPEQWDQAYGNVSGSRAFKDQQAGVEQLRQLAVMAAQRKSQLDLSPLAALVDAQTGSHFAQSYQRPETADQRWVDAMNSAQKIQSDQKDLSKSILETATKEKGGYMTDIQKMMLASQLGVTAADPSMKRSMAQPVNHFMTQTRMESQKMREDDSQLQKVLVAVNSGNPAEQKGVPLQIARLIEGARPAMAAAAVESGDPSLIERISQTASKLSSGQLTPENVGQYTQFIRDMQKVNELAKHGLIKRWTTSGAEMGLSTDAIQGMIPQDWLTPYSGQTANIMSTSPKPHNVVKPGKHSNAGPGGPGGAMSFEQWKAAQGK